MNFSTMTVKQKLFSVYGLLAVLTLIVGGSAMYLVHDLGETTNLMGLKIGQKAYDAGMANGDSAEFMSYSRGLVLAGVDNDKAALDESVKVYQSSEDDMRARLADMKQAGLTARGVEIVEAISNDLANIDPIHDKLVTQVRAGDLKSAETTLAQLHDSLRKVDDDGTALCDLQKTLNTEAAADAQAKVNHSYMILLVLVLLSVAIGAAAIWVIRGLDSQLRKAVTELNEGSGQVAQAATEVSSSSQALSRESSEQAAMIEETSASAEEVNSMAKRNADHARTATELVGQAVQSTEQTTIAVGESVDAMNAIGDSSSQIAKTLQVIDKIAFQTNILALNAAVEAARAGEAGMGFAVVAEEVRNLAQRCASASQEIGVLIEKSLQNSEVGRAKIGSLVEAGERVNLVFRDMRKLVEEICLSSEEQGRGIDQIRTAIQRMEQGTQKSAASAEEGAAAAEELTAQSEALNHVANELGRMVGGSVQHNVSLRMTPSRSRSSAPRSSALLKPLSKMAAPSRMATVSASPSSVFPLDDDSNFTEF